VDRINFSYQSERTPLVSKKPFLLSFKELWVRPFTMAQLLQSCLVIHAVLVLVFFAIYGRNTLVDSETALLAIVLDGVLVASLYWCDDESYPQMILLVWFMGIFILPRVLSYLVMNNELIRFPFQGGFTSENVNRAILYLILGTCCIVGGFRAASWIWCLKRPKRGATQDDVLLFSPLVLSIVWFVVLAVEWYFMIWMGASPFNLDHALSISGLWLIHLFSSDTIALITVVMVLSNSAIFRKHRNFVVVVLLVYLLTGILEGSRGGVLRVGWMIGVVMLSFAGNFRISLKRGVVFLLSILILNGLLYPVATHVRHIHAGLDGKKSLLLSLGGSGGMGGGVEGWAEKLHKFDDWGPFRLVPYAGMKIINRIGLLDYIVTIVSDEGNSIELERYINYGYVVKNFINNAVLGSPFPEAEIMTSRVMTIIYRGANEQHVRKVFLSEPWTIWGTGYVYFGRWGGLVALFIIAFLVQIVFVAIMNFSGPYKYYAASYYLFGSTLAGFLMNFGFDHWLTIVFYFFLSSVTTFVLLHGISHTITWIRSVMHAA